jgi:Ca2+/H+ antiporter
VQKLLLLSVIIATFAIPALLERRTGGRTTFATLLGASIAFVGLYVLGLIFIYPRLF